MSDLFSFTVDTIDGEIQFIPPIITFSCDKIVPIGVTVVKSFDQALNVVAKRVFVFDYKGHSFGSTQFQNLFEFQTYIAGQCACCPDHCHVLVNACNLLLNGCNLVLDQSMIPECLLIINGCNLTFNGCAITLN